MRAMTDDEKQLIDECIQSHLRMIKMHRKSIQQLQLKKTQSPEMSSLNLKILKSDKK